MNGLFDIAQEPFNMLPLCDYQFVHGLSKMINYETEVWVSEEEVLEKANGVSVFSSITTS